jgi:hypothetical protein
MSDIRPDDAERKIERKANRRAFFSGALTIIILIHLLFLISYSIHKPEVPIRDAFVFILYLVFIISPIGGLIGSYANRTKNIISGTLKGAIVLFAFYISFTTVLTYRGMMPLLFIPLYSCGAAAIGALCGGIGAMFGRICRESEGKRFWPQFSVAELLTGMFLIAVLLSCIMTMKQILGR